MKKLKILLSNKYYYPRAGDCVYSLELEKLLKRNGHDVAFFAMQHEANLTSDYEKYFPSEVDYSKRNLAQYSKYVRRPLFSSEVKLKFRSLLDQFEPDIVHVNNIHSQLSPIIVKEAYNLGIPVVWTLHDYKLLCPRYDSLLNGNVCELCYDNKLNVLRNKCLKGSLSGSLIAYAEAKVWSQKRLEKYTSKFICPSHFIKDKMLAGGFDSAKLNVIHNFINDSRIATGVGAKENYYCYVGRLSKEKGIETLCKAAVELPNYEFYIVGTGPEENILKEKYSVSNIKFLGHRGWNELQKIVSKAQFMVLPSEWYENNPLSIIEALANGTPVIGADIGGIPELIHDRVNGLLFRSGDSKDLKAKIEFFYNEFHKIIDYQSMINNASIAFSSTNYYNKLIEIYSDLIKN